MGMTAQQAKWAMQHDWARVYNFVDTNDLTKGYYVMVRDSGTKLVNGISVEFSELVTFEDYEELREWAGY